VGSSSTRMSEMVIDPETGMPQVPEKFYWRVYDNGLVEAGGGLAVELVRESTRQSWYYPWWFAGFYSMFDWEIKKLRKYYTYNEDRSISIGYTPSGSYSKAIVLRAATEVYTSWQKDVQRAEQINEVVGMYPPKKLEGVEK
jgi:hypothetical protein